MRVNFCNKPEVIAKVKSKTVNQSNILQWVIIHKKVESFLKLDHSFPKVFSLISKKKL